MALESMRHARASDEVRELIEARLKAGHDLATRLEAAESRGVQRGLEQGIERGIEQGIERGIEQGMKSVATRLRDQGFDDETIFKATGLRLQDL